MLTTHVLFLYESIWLNSVSKGKNQGIKIVSKFVLTFIPKLLTVLQTHFKLPYAH